MVVSPTMPKRGPRLRRRLTLTAAVASVAVLVGCFFVEMNSPAQQERWRWLVGAALTAILLAGGVLIFGRDRMRPIFRAPLTGLFVGIVAVVIVGAIAAAVEWLMTDRSPTASLRAAVWAGLPAGAVVGTVMGLIGWLVFRLIPYRAPRGPRSRNAAASSSVCARCYSASSWCPCRCGSRRRRIATTNISAPSAICWRPVHASNSMDSRRRSGWPRSSATESIRNGTPQCGECPSTGPPRTKPCSTSSICRS